MSNMYEANRTVLDTNEILENYMKENHLIFDLTTPEPILPFPMFTRPVNRKDCKVKIPPRFLGYEKFFRAGDVVTVLKSERFQKSALPARLIVINETDYTITCRWQRYTICINKVDLFTRDVVMFFQYVYDAEGQHFRLNLPGFSPYSQSA